MNLLWAVFEVMSAIVDPSFKAGRYVSSGWGCSRSSDSGVDNLDSSNHNKLKGERNDTESVCRDFLTALWF